eukprot:COSAG05_NODE_1162_length_5658_cov_33.118367_5_plen_100_part_01
MNMKDEDGFEPTRESTHLSLPTRYELANGFTSIPSRLLGDLEEKHLRAKFLVKFTAKNLKPNRQYRCTFVPRHQTPPILIVQCLASCTTRCTIHTQRTCC